MMKGGFQNKNPSPIPPPPENAQKRKSRTIGSCRVLVVGAQKTCMFLDVHLIEKHIFNPAYEKKKKEKEKNNQGPHI